MNNISVVGPINTLSYGKVTTNIIQQLNKLGSKVYLSPIADVNIPQFINYVDTSEHDCPSIKIWHMHNMDGFKGSPKIGFPIFELDRFTQQEQDELQKCDKMFTCSEWGKRVIAQYFKEEDIHVIPLGVNTDIYRPLNTPRSGNIKFLNIGKWEKRKGHDILHTAFRDAFIDTDDVELWMSNTNIFYDCSHFCKMYKDTLGEKVKFVPWLESEHDMAELMNMVDVGIYPTRAEGWNLSLLEMLSCGAEVVATNVTGQTEYLNEDNATLIQPEGMEPAVDNIWFHGQGDWHKFNYNDIVESLRVGYERAKERRRNSERNTNGIRTGAKFSWAATANSIRRAVS